MLVTLAPEYSIQIINIVRKEEQAALLKDMGAEYVVNSFHDDFEKQLGDLTRKLNANVCFEAVGGKLTAQVLKKMPARSLMIVYGLLSEEAMSDIHPLELIGRKQKIEGFFLGDWLQNKSIWFTLGVINKARKLIANKTFHSEVAHRISLFEVRDAIPEYKKNMTVGKYLIYP